MTRGGNRRVITENLPEGSDLYTGIVRVANEHGIRFGTVTGNGSVKKAMISMFDQKSMTAKHAEVPEPMEIISMYGEIVVTGGVPVARVHLVLADPDGNGKGGQLLPKGTLVHQCQVSIEEG